MVAAATTVLSATKLVFAAALLLLCGGHGGGMSIRVVGGFPAKIPEGLAMDYTGKCDEYGLDGTGLALTPELYNKGPDAYKDAVCIPGKAFCTADDFAQYDYCKVGSPGLTFEGDVTLESMPKLVYVGFAAFLSFQGKLTIQGSFPMWKEIGPFAFWQAGTNDSSIVLNGADVGALETVREQAFRSFQGKLTIQGAFPMWKEIGVSAFSGAGTADSSIVLNGADAGALETVGSSAFYDFGGKLTAKGTFPNLKSCLTLPSGDVLAFGLALTPDLYKEGYDAYKDAVCIPSVAFCQCAKMPACFECVSVRESVPGWLPFEGNMTLGDMDKLVDVGFLAFKGFTGKLTIQGSFKMLKEIGRSAFSEAGTADSSIVLNGADVGALETVREEAFRFFKGKLTIQGSFPMWKEIGVSAFSGAGTADSSIVLNGADAGALETVGNMAFDDFRGKLTAKGTFPNLKSCVTLPGGDVLAFGLALTPDLYKEGYDAYKDAVCIPSVAFCHKSCSSCGYKGSTASSIGLTFDRDVSLTNMTKLMYVGESAFGCFGYFNRKLTIQGPFPKWKEIGVSAFSRAGTADSLIALDGADVGALETVGESAFAAFQGKLTIQGPFPKWEENGLGAFWQAGNADSLFAIDCRGENWYLGTRPHANPEYAFNDNNQLGFKGNHNAEGERIACCDTTTTTTTTITTTTGLCNGKPDDDACILKKTTDCNKTLGGNPYTELCPSLCDSCNARAQTTTGKSTASSPAITATSTATATAASNTTTITAACLHHSGNCGSGRDCTANFGWTYSYCNNCNGGGSCCGASGGSSGCPSPPPPPPNDRGMSGGGIAALVIIPLLLLVAGFAGWYKGWIHMPACLGRSTNKHTQFGNDGDDAPLDPAVADMFLQPLSSANSAVPTATIEVAGATTTTSSADGDDAGGTTGPKTRRSKTKFVANTIRLGRATQAAAGLADLMGYNDMSLLHIIMTSGGGTDAIVHEVNANGTEEDKRTLRAVIDGTYIAPDSSDDGGPPENLTAQHRTIDELMQTNEAKTAKLQRAHVLALVLYTTPSYVSMNNPLRADPPTQPHPLAVTTYFASQGIKLLRSVAGNLPNAHEARVCAVHVCSTC